MTEKEIERHPYKLGRLPKFKRTATAQEKQAECSVEDMIAQSQAKISERAITSGQVA